MKKPRVVIEVMNNVRCRLVGGSRALLKYLDAQLAEQQKGSEWAPNNRRFGGRWDGKRHHFYRSPTTAGVGTFAKGLLSRVRALCKKQQVKVKVRDARRALYPAIDVSQLKPTMLRGVTMDGEFAYQLDAVKAALLGEAGVLWMATNAGKTEIAAAIIKALRGRTILFVVPKAILLKQTRERIAERLGTIPETIGVIGGGRFEPKEITVAIINSVTPARRARSLRAKKRNMMLRSYLKSVNCVFLDEGHHAKATTWFRLMSACVNAQYRYLMSGTPFTGDNDLMIEAAAGPVLYEIHNDDLIKLGVSAKPLVRMIAVDKPDLEGKDALDDQSWHAVYTSGIVENEYRNRLIVREAKRYSQEGKNVLILLRIINHGSNIRMMLAEEGVPVEFAHGKMPGSARDEIVDWFVSKPGRVLVGSTIFDEGVNVPEIHALIIADGGKSLRAILQKIGRSIRRKRFGANVVAVVDLADCTHHWLAKHALDRFDIYAGEGFDVIEEDPKTSKKEKGNVKVGKQAVQALSRKVASRDSVSRDLGQFAIRGIEFSTDEGTEEFLESSDVMLWRWRQAA